MTYYRINTTKNENEDFILKSNLSEFQIIEAIKPRIINERTKGIFYTNEDLINDILKIYPNSINEYILENYITI